MKRRLKRIAIYAAIVLLASLIIRVPRPDGTGARVQFDSEIGWAPKLVEERRAAGITEEQIVGQRNDVIDPNRDHVAVIGDSVLYAMGLEDDETPSYFLDQRLDGPQVLNLSVTGWSIDQYYLYLKRVLPRLNAKVAIVGVFTGNDYQGTVENHNYGHKKSIFRIEGGELAYEPAGRELNCFNHGSRTLFFYLFWMWGQHNGHDGGREKVGDLLSWVCGGKKVAEPDARPLIAKLFRETQNLADQHDTKLLYVLLPRSVDFDDPERLKGRFWLQPWPTLEFFREVLKEGGYDTYDFTEGILESKYCEQSTEGRPKCDVDGVFLDGAHYSRGGAELFAEVMARELDTRYGIR